MVCIYHNTRISRRGFRTVSLEAVPPLDPEKEENLLELDACGTKMVDDIPSTRCILFEDEHDENSEEIKSGSWPPHSMKGLQEPLQ